MKLKWLVDDKFMLEHIMLISARFNKCLTVFVNIFEYAINELKICSNKINRLVIMLAQIFLFFNY